ncbi:MAG TPA: ABC transporter permease [Actinomycetota bacterium]|nr:ABC transporter permease [Actinomycetota bacterium]
MTVEVAAARLPTIRRSGLSKEFHDGTAMMGRNLIAYKRVPQLLVFSTIQPIIFVLMFRYVFGGVVQKSLPPGVEYVNFLMPGIWVQTVVFGAIAAAIGLATDLKSGMLERFASLPVTRSAVLVGRTGADLIRNVFVVILMLAVGMIVGFRVGTNVIALIAAMALVALFGFALSWIFATLGLAVKDPETAQAAAFPVLAPLVFASIAFVPANQMPGWLQPWANNQPVSAVVLAARALVNGGPTAHYVIQALIWCAAVLLIFVPLGVRTYRRAL